jgi:hypothetical protein
MSPEERIMHICYAFTKLNASGEGETMRLDFIIIALGILLAVAMVLTLLYGKEYSRHGYGRIMPVNDDASCVTVAPCCRFT